MAIAIVVTPSVARGEPACRDRHRLAAPHCGSSEENEAIARAVAIELGGDDPDGALLDVERLVCEDPDRYVVEARVADGRSARRDVDLHDTLPADRPRVLAFVAAEVLARACESPKEATPAPKPAPEPPPASQPKTTGNEDVEPSRPPATARPRQAAEAALPPASGASLDASVGARVFPAFTAALAGVEIGGSLAPAKARPFVLTARAFAFTGSTRDSLGDIALGAYGGSLGAALRAGTDAFEVRGGPRIDVAWVTARGSTDVPGVVASGGGALAWIAAVEGETRARVSSDWALFLSGGAGRAVRGVRARADAREPSGVAGVEVSFAVGVGWQIR